MQFFSTAGSQLGTIVIGLGAGLGVWGVINLLEGYGNDNPGAKRPGHEAAYRRRRRCAGRLYARSAALQPFLSVVKKKITGTPPRTHAAALAPKEGDPL